MLITTRKAGRFRSRVIFITLLLTAVLSGLSHSAIAASSDRKLQEYKVKAVFLYNFTQLIRWPDNVFLSDDEPLKVCVLGDNPFDGKLAQILKGETAGERPLTLAKMVPSDPVEQCQILFVSESSRNSFVAVRSRLQNLAVLTVGDYEEFIGDGGMIQLASKKKRIYFKVHLARIKNHGVFPSSKLLRLAVIVDQAK